MPAHSAYEDYIITYVTSEDSDEAVHQWILTRAFSVRTHNQMALLFTKAHNRIAAHARRFNIALRRKHTNFVKTLIK